MDRDTQTILYLTICVVAFFACNIIQAGQKLSYKKELCEEHKVFKYCNKKQLLININSK